MAALNTDTPIAAQDPVKLDTGLISGAVTGENRTISVYKGIPYAAPPVGDLRWRPPAPVQAWAGIREAREFGPIPPQEISPVNLGVIEGLPQSEDCLYLNIWTPATSRIDKLPVMVWLHGGAFEFGAGSLPAYDGTKLAEREVIVVTVNYRLGCFGMFAHPLLTEESGHHASGNYALMDQIAALKWVQKNISGFGGDPDRVTLFGESAGSRSITVLMVSELARGLFHRGICQSGATRHVSHPLEQRESDGMKIGKALNAVSLQALRSKHFDELKAAGGLNANPMVDGWIIPDDPRQLYASGRQYKLPLIIGVNQDEATLFISGSPVETRDDFRNLLKKRFKDKADAVLQLYPVDSDEGVYDAMNRYVTDAWFVLHARKQLRWMENIGADTYAYHFTRVPPTVGGKWLRAHHGGEIAYVFGNIGPQWGRAEDADTSLSDSMMTYWTRFAATGNPNADGLPNWPVYTKALDPYLELGDQMAVTTALRKKALDVLDDLMD